MSQLGTNQMTVLFVVMVCGDILKQQQLLTNMKPTTNNLEGWIDKEFPDNYCQRVSALELKKQFKQFISDLRKKDMEELIKMFEGDYFETNNKEIGQLIQDYYES
jgi:methyl coenzyme M reductase subunit C-like uncharacterized protein (methanogenesis marker protein 7)